MTNFVEEQLAVGMRERVAGITITTDVVGETLRVQRRRVMITRIASMVGVVGLAGAITAGVLAVTDTGPATVPNRPSVAGAESPELRLAAAVAASQNSSYRLKITIDYPAAPGAPSMIVEGAFDPVATTGYLRSVFADGTRGGEERLIDGDRYTAVPGSDGKLVWWRHPGKFTKLDFKRFITVVSADPQSQFDTLKQSGAKISRTGPDTYHFEAPMPKLKGDKDGRMIGDVTVGADQRVAKVAYEAVVDATTVLAGVTMELSDYGAPVTVERLGPNELPRGK